MPARTPDPRSESRTGFVCDPIFVEHDTGAGHPERADRLRALHAHFERTGLGLELDTISPRAATRPELERVHTAALVDQVQAATRACTPGERVSLDADTFVSSASFEAASRAAGGVIQACERVLDGTWNNAFCAVRPPGHHAEAGRAMGFCLFNSIAVAAADLLERGMQRVAVLDWDVHHGNGTQHIFESDPRVLYASLHQFPLFPGTGALNEHGTGDGEGTTLNMPMDAGTTDADWMRALEQTVLPALEQFAPDFVLVSAGFDGHQLDPLAGVCLSEDGFGAMTRSVLACANGSANGRLVSVLEGGYHLEALPASAAAHVGELVSHTRPE